MVELGAGIMTTAHGTSPTSSEEASGMLPLLTVAGNLQSSLAALDSQIRQHMTGLTGLFEKQANKLSTTQLRLRHAEVRVIPT